jgi:hypothetical protein
MTNPVQARGRRVTRWNFKYVVRLFDPVTHAAAAQRSVPLWVGC